MDDQTLHATLATEARRVLETAADALDRPVPWLDEWTVGRVVGHLASVQRWATWLADHPGEQIRRRDLDPAPTDASVVDWYAAGVEPMLQAFDGTDLDVVVHTWAGERPRRWWLRRLAHETAVHRWDVDAGAGSPDRASPIDAAVAVDGIDELFENFLPLVAEAFGGTGQTMHLHATDAPGEWQLTFEPDAVHVERMHAKGDVAVRGPAAALLLLLWHRTDTSAPGLEVFGDDDVLELWHQTAQF
jgi:uncharacterized protein (TIGR03083 family)